MPLTKDRNTWRRDAPRTMPVAVAADTIIYQGALVARNLAGYAVPATATPGHTVLGRAEHRADNRGGADGAMVLVVGRGVFLWDNAAANGVTQADFGQAAYVVDDFIVGKQAAAGSSVVAGIVEGIDERGIWVATV